MIRRYRFCAIALANCLVDFINDTTPLFRYLIYIYLLVQGAIALANCLVVFVLYIHRLCIETGSNRSSLYVGGGIGLVSQFNPLGIIFRSARIDKAIPSF